MRLRFSRLTDPPGDRLEARNDRSFRDENVGRAAMRVPLVSHWVERARQSFWLLPAIYVLIAVCLAVCLPILNVTTHSPLLFPGGPEAARSFLSSITTSMISVTGVVFSITIVALQLAAGQFSSRVMRDFLRDRTTQHTFGVFVGTFTYAMVLQRSVRGTSGSAHAFVPQLAVTVSFGLVLFSVAFFIVYITHIANSIRVANIVARIGRETRSVLDAIYPPTVEPAPAPPERQPDRYVPCPHPGVVVSINAGALVSQAAASDTFLAVIPRQGDFVPGGAPLIAVYGTGFDDDAALVHIAMDTERTYEQDVAFGFRELVDIAERALSPAVNDPTTAAQAVDIMHDLLRRIVTRPTPTGRHADASGSLRLVVPVYTFADLLTLALEEVEHYGKADVQTPRRLRAMLQDLITVALPAHLPLLRQRLSELPAGPGLPPAAQFR